MSSGKTSSGHTVIPHKPLVCPYHINYAKLSQTQHIKPIIPGNTDIALQQLIKSGSTLRSTPDKQYNRTPCTVTIGQKKRLMATLTKRQQADNHQHNKAQPWTSGRKKADGHTDKRQMTDNQAQSKNTPWTSGKKRADGHTDQKTTNW